MKRRTVITTLGLLAAFGALPNLAIAQADATGFPSRAVRIVVPYTAGGAGDLIVRLLAKNLSQEWGQPVITDNRPGAGGIIGTQAVVDAEPDGYTLVFAITSLINFPILYPNVPFDPLKDLEPISQLAVSPVAFVVGSESGIDSMPQYIERVRSSPKGLAYGSFSPGSSSHIYGEQLKSVAKLDLTHVPYRGESALLPDVISGTVSGGFVSVASAASMARGGRIRVLGVTGESRTPALPEVPTMQELGLPGFEATGWFALLAPAGTPKAIVDKISRDVNIALQAPELQQQTADLGLEAIGSTPEEMTNRMRNDFEIWNRLIKTHGIKTS
ncbi:MAG: Bug family tripartite tricarboxylate transporter substrate binding protein [Pigmentiphaga sp.]